MSKKGDMEIRRYGDKGKEGMLTVVALSPYRPIAFFRLTQ